MDLRRLRYFVTLAEMLHFRRAAERLHVTQPTLSHQIKALEDSLGTNIFERVGHKVHLTAAGRIFKEHAQRALKEIEIAETEIGELEGLLRGNLAIGVIQSFNSYMLPPLMRKFHALYPGIHVIVRQLPRQEMNQRIISGELDLGIAYVSTSVENVQTEELFEETYALIVGKRHPLYGRKRIQMSTLHKYPLVLLTSEFPLRPVLDDSFSLMATKPQVIMEMNSTDAILETIRNTSLATILGSRRPRAIADVHCIELDPPIKRTAAIFWRRGGYRSKAAVALTNLIKSTYAQKRAQQNLFPAR